MNNAIKTMLTLLVAGVGLSEPNLSAQLTIPGNDGTDGTFFPLETNTVVNLANAVTGKWDQPSSAPGKGVYDPEQWVIVFKYRNVVIPRGFKVSFTNHPSRAPVIWLVQNNANVEGTVDVSGSATIVEGLREPGPGGFRGGASDEPGLTHGPGFGPGGGLRSDGVGLSGVYNYGNARILPLIGGSGGAGYVKPSLDTGASGGGAILIAAGSTLTINGQILADGGPSFASTYGASGGAIRLLANRVEGSGLVRAIGSPDYGPYLGLVGRIRIETPAISDSLIITPQTIAISPSSPIDIVPPVTSPKVKLLSVGGIQPKPDPIASMGNRGADLIVTNSNPVDVIIETRNMPTNSIVKAMFKPKHHGVRPNGQPSTFDREATYTGANGDAQLWLVREQLPLGHFVIQARASTRD